jgi:hypothetical protein
MAEQLRLVFHHDAFDELRRSDPVRLELERRGKQIAKAAGGEPDFEVQSGLHKSRARVVVITATPKAMEAEATHHVLTRALDAGRG